MQSTHTIPPFQPFSVNNKLIENSHCSMPFSGSVVNVYHQNWSGPKWLNTWTIPSPSPPSTLDRKWNILKGSATKCRSTSSTDWHSLTSRIIHHFLSTEKWLKYLSSNSATRLIQLKLACKIWIFIRIFIAATMHWMSCTMKARQPMQMEFDILNHRF